MAEIILRRFHQCNLDFLEISGFYVIGHQKGMLFHYVYKVLRAVAFGWVFYFPTRTLLALFLRFSHPKRNFLHFNQRITRKLHFRGFANHSFPAPLLFRCCPVALGGIFFAKMVNFVFLWPFHHFWRRDPTFGDSRAPPARNSVQTNGFLMIFGSFLIHIRRCRRLLICISRRSPQP